MARTRAELEEAVRQLRLLNADEEVQQLADAEDWARYDYNSAMAEVKEKGLAAGLAKGRAEGRTEEKNELVKKMLEKKMNIDLISELTGLTKEEIENLTDYNLYCFMVN